MRQTKQKKSMLNEITRGKVESSHVNAKTKQKCLQGSRDSMEPSMTTGREVSSHIAMIMT